MLIMIVVPIFEAIAFWGVLRRPRKLSSQLVDSSTEDIVNSDLTLNEQSSDSKDVEGTHPELSEDEKPLIGLKNKLKYIPSLFKYMIPLTLVYFLEYLINQGMVSIFYIF